MHWFNSANGFGSIDFVYYERFFQELSSGNAVTEINKQNITIVTKNDNSHLEIKNRIREMNVDVQRLYEQSHLNFIITDEKNDHVKLDEILFSLKNRMMMKRMGIKWGCSQSKFISLFFKRQYYNKKTS